MVIETNRVIEGVAGIGNPLTNAGLPVDGLSGTGVTRAPKGAKLIDTTNGVDYINVGTISSPAWVKTGTQL